MTPKLLLPADVKVLPERVAFQELWIDWPEPGLTVTDQLEAPETVYVTLKRSDHDSARVAVIRAGLDTLPNIHVVGRNGMHKYNNQDHSMTTAMLTVENIANGDRRWDVWCVNQDAEYHEEGEAGSE